MKRFILLMLTLIIITGLSGCTNPSGNIGPSWDVGVKVPLSSEEEVSVSELFKDVDGVDLDGDIVEYATTKELQSVDVGSYITDVGLTGTSIESNVSLEPITIADISGDSGAVNIPAGVSGDGDTVDFNSISITDLPFNSIDFSDDSGNELQLWVKAPDGFDIEQLDISLLGQLLTFNDVTAGDTSSLKTVSLAGESLDDPFDISVDYLSTSGTSGESGNMVLYYSTTSPEIDRVEGYTGEFSENIEGSTTVELPFTKFDLRSIEFDSGSMDISITPPDTSLSFAVHNINIGGITDSSTDNNVNLDLSGQQMNVDTETTNSVDVGYDISVSGSDITYDASQAIDFTADFSSPVISAVSARFDEYDSDTLLGEPVTETINELNLPDRIDDIEDIEFNNLSVGLVIENNTGDPDNMEADGITADLSNIRFNGKDSSGNNLTSFNLGEVDSDSADVGRGKTTLSLVNSEANADFVDLLTAKPDTIEVLVSNSDPQIGFDVSSSQPVVITDESNFSMEASINFGFDITLKNAYEFEVEPISTEGISEEDKDIIDNNSVKHARLVLTDIDNQLPVEANIDLYLAGVSSNTDLTAEQLYLDENKIKNSSFEIESRMSSPADKEIVLEKSEITEKLTADKLYFGLVVTIPAGDYRLEADDYVSFDKAYSILDVEVNK